MAIKGVKTVSTEDFAEAIRKELEIYSDEVFEKVLKDATDTAEQCRNDVRTNAKAVGIPNDTGYCNDWWVKNAYENLGKRVVRKVIHSRKHYRIAHLLEHGHAKVGGGRVSGRPHILPAEEKAVKDYEQKIRQHLGG